MSVQLAAFLGAVSQSAPLAPESTQNTILLAFHYAITGSFLGVVIYFTLITLSVMAWGIIIKKFIDMRLERRKAKEFRRRFNELEGNIVALAQAGIQPANSPARLFVSAYEELRLWATLDRANNCIIADRPVVPALERTLDRAIETEKGRWERGTTLLATVASIGPLLGLLGTVWGVFLTFHKMGSSDSASLSSVAPGISEALLTTVGGLLVAIPAVFAYNGILRSIRNMESELENFASEIINQFDRQIVIGEIPQNQNQIQPRAAAIPRRPRGIS